MLSDLGRDTQKISKNKSSQIYTLIVNAEFLVVLGMYRHSIHSNIGYSSLKNKVIWQVTSFSRDVFVELAELTVNKGINL